MTHDIEHWHRQGFRFQQRFPGEYDFWIAVDTMQKLRLYLDGRIWQTDKFGNYVQIRCPWPVPAVKDLVEALRAAGQREHGLTCEYHKAVECPARHGELCKCGADEHNAGVDAAAAALLRHLEEIDIQT